MFDHFQAVVKTLCIRLRGGAPTMALPEGLAAEDGQGGCTYTFDLWEGHPMSAQVLETLVEYRKAMTALRREVDAINASCGLPKKYAKVLCFAGQSLIEDEDDEVVR